MANKMDKNNITDERIEDTTLYGEFIASFDQWMTIDRQKNIASHLENVTAHGSADGKPGRFFSRAGNFAADSEAMDTAETENKYSN